MYDLHYQIAEVLAAEASTIEPVELYDVDPQKLLVDCLNRMAQPIGEGLASPLSSRNPASGEGIITSVLLIMLQYFGHELNLFPDALLLNHLRVLGLTRQIPTSPLIELQFRFDNDVAEPVVPEGARIRSRYYAERTAIVIEDATEIVAIEGSDSIYINAIAKIDEPGQLKLNVREQEFTLVPIALSNQGIAAVTNTKIISAGQEQETVAEVIKRARSLLARPGDRVITARDYQDVALTLGGAAKAIVLPKLGVKDNGETIYWSDLITVAVYPTDAVDATYTALIDKIPAGTRLEVIPARILPIDGKITVGIDPQLTQAEAYDLVATSIIDNINPPFGNWGDRHFSAHLSTAIEKIIGIYSFKPEILKHSETGVLLEDLTIYPYDLLEIQQSIEFEWDI